MGRRDPLERIVDLVVAVPLSVVAAARQLMPFDTGPVERRISSMVGRNRDVIVRYGGRRPASRPGSPSKGAAADAPPPPPPADDASSPTIVEDEVLPIDGYDQLSARQIVDRLDGLTADELTTVARYERSHRRRQTVLGRIEQLS